MSADRPDAGAVDHLEPGGRPQGRSRRRTATVGIAAAAVIGVVGAGAWGVAQFLDGGTAAAAAVPANALAYVSLDLDPSGGQKLEAARTLREFPAVKEKVGSGDDLRRWLFEAILDEAPCDDVGFADDIDPWVGNKMAFAVVPGAQGEDPVPMGVVEVKEEAAAEAGVEKIAACDGSDAPGTAFVEGFMVIAETDKIADDLVSQVEDGALADDDGFNRWVDEAGGSGIVTGYASAEAPMTMLDLMEGGMESASASSGVTGSKALVAGRAPAVPDEFDDEQFGDDEFGMLNPLSPLGTSEEQVAEAFEEFDGGALSLRFDDGALELEVASGGVASGVSGEGGSGMADLPSTTALALGISFSDTAAEELIARLTETMGEKQAATMIAEAEQQTGLSLPEDLQTLLGGGVSVAVDGSIDLDALFGMGGGEPSIPAGARIVGDPDEIVPLLEKLISSAGAEGEVVVESGDGVVAFGVDSEYVASLAGDGALGDEPQFESALPDLEERAGGLYLDFDAGDWLAELAEQDAELRENLEPLDSLGITSWEDGDVVHGKVRLSTD